MLLAKSMIHDMIFLIKKILFNIFSEDRLSKMYWLHNKNVPTDVTSLDFLLKIQKKKYSVFVCGSNWDFKGAHYILGLIFFRLISIIIYRFLTDKAISFYMTR